MESLKFGAFIPPIHPIRENPSLCIERDLKLVEHMDSLGYDEVWFGEHHSAGTELFASPELMILAAHYRTHRIKLGTGVSSLPYHHPLVFADRFIQLHNMTQGRAIYTMQFSHYAEAPKSVVDELSENIKSSKSLEAIK